MKFSRGMFGLALMASLAVAQARAQAPSGLAIVGFGDYLWLRVNGRAVTLEPGSPAYEIPFGARTVVAQGAATLLIRETLLRVDAGDEFSVTWEGSQARLLVNSGSVSVSMPGRPPVSVEAGRFLALTGAEASSPVVPIRAAAQLPPAPVEREPSAQPEAAEPRPAAPKEWDPLTALAAGVSKLSALGTPEVRLVLELHPFYRLTQTYDSNIYLVPPDKANGVRTGGGVLASWITINELGTGWKIPLNKRSTLQGRYAAKASNYSTQGKTNNAVDQEIGGNYRYAGQRGTAFSVGETYTNTEESAFSEQVARQRRMMNATDASLSWEVGRVFAFTLGANHQLHKYLDPSLANNLNRFEATLSGDAGVKLAPKTKLYIAYSRGLTHFSAGRKDHSRTNRIGVGLSGVFTSRISGCLQVDLNKRRYENTPAGQPRDNTAFLTAVSLKYKAGRRTDASLGLARGINEATFRTSRFYVSNSVNAAINHTWRSLTLSGNASYQSDRYPEATTLGTVTGNRRDDIYGAGVGVAYKMRPWLSTSLSYKRTQRFSFFQNDFNYLGNSFSLGLNAQF